MSLDQRVVPGYRPRPGGFSVIYTRQLLCPLPCEHGRPQGTLCGFVQDIVPSGAGVKAYTKGSPLWSSFSSTPGPRSLDLELLSKVRGTDKPC